MTQDPWWRQRHELGCAPHPEWVDRCSAWLQRPRGDLGPAGWLVLLLAEHVDPGFRFPDGTLHVATHLEWSAPATEAPFDVVVAPAWVAPHDRTAEVALTVRAHREGAELASCVGVYRVPGHQDPLGEAADLQVPDGPPGDPQRVRLTLDAGQVEAFAAVAGTGHPVHEDPGYAHQHGFPGVVVQGPLLAATVMHHARPGDAGTARFWFRRPVSAGTLLRLEHTGPEGGRSRWWVAKATGDVVAAAEVETSPPGSH